MNDKVKDDKVIFDLKEKAIKAALSDFIKTPGGKNWIRNIANQGLVLSQAIFTGNSHTFHLLGKRDVALSILRDAKDANPDAYAEIIKEIEL